MGSKLTLITVCLTIACSSSCSSVRSDNEPSRGWVFPTIGQGAGDWSASIGLLAWNNACNLRNLQVRGDIDLGRGLRAHAVLRSDKEMESLRVFQPHIDEGYLEAYGYRYAHRGVLSGSLRVGATRYLRFPYPDSISTFDQVPGVSDLLGGSEASYNGSLLVLDYAHPSGLGVHFTGIKWGLGRTHGNGVLECYSSYVVGRSPHFEARLGRLPLRHNPVGESKVGYNTFLGVDVKGYSVGLLYEKLQRQPAYTGIMIRFTRTRTTRAFGAIAADYDRSPQGIAMQLPLASRRIGRFRRTAPENGILVGQVHAERVRTYWQNGQVRNYYEHRSSSEGETGTSDLVAVVDEEPWVLEYEALVSPHVFGRDGWSAWERDRMGPAHITQRVTYKFYRVQ